MYASDSYYNTDNFPVYLGDSGANWHYFGNPTTGRVASIATLASGAKCSHFGDAGYFSGHVLNNDHAATRSTFALACRGWDWRRFWRK